MTLRDRCKEFLSQQAQRGMMRVGSPVDDLMEFVLSERGKGVDPKLESSLPIVMYFRTEEDREEAISEFREVFPGAVVKKMP